MHRITKNSQKSCNKKKVYFKTIQMSKKNENACRDYYIVCESNNGGESILPRLNWSRNFAKCKSDKEHDHKHNHDNRFESLVLEFRSYYRTNSILSFYF